MIFADRADAGRKLASLVAERIRGEGRVLGIPRGGVIVAKIVADRINWPLEMIQAKKIGAPGNPELAVGAKVEPPFPKLTGVKQAVIVDDGIATGHTVEAAINYLRGQSLKIIVAVPVCAADTAQRLKKSADQWLCLFEPDDLMAVGQYYQNFAQ